MREELRELRGRRRRRATLFGRWGWLLLGLPFVALCVVTPSLASKGRGRAVASESPEAARQAMAQLRAGGNAADAAVTAALVAGVVSPSSSGLGGGAFIHYFDAAAKRAIILDAREAAPAAFDAAGFETRPLPPEQRGRLVGVPGELRGLYELHQRYGRRSWAEVVMPAAEVAANGFVVNEHLARVLGFARESLIAEPAFKELWFLKGSPLKPGARVKNPKLAATLKRIAHEGPKAFYEGSIAADLVNAVRRHGGALSMDDLANYQVVQREPLTVQWEGYTVHTMPLPSAGGLMLAQTLGLFSKAELRRLGFNTPAYQHALGEAFRAAIADRLRYLGDPGFQAVDLPALLQAPRLRQRRDRLSMFRTRSLGALVQPEQGTHHLITADAAGNVVSLTTTVNKAFGAKILAPNSGVVLNDELDDFTLRKWVEPLGMEQSPNRPRPGARPVSSMTPTLVVKEGRVVLAAGGSGGFNIATNVAQMVVARLTFDRPISELLREPRIQIPLGGATLRVPAETPPEHVADLRLRGEVVEPVRFTSTAVQLLTDVGSGWAAAADPRKFGLALTE